MRQGKFGRHPPTRASSRSVPSCLVSCHAQCRSAKSPRLRRNRSLGVVARLPPDRSITRPEVLPFRIRALCFREARLPSIRPMEFPQKEPPTQVGATLRVVIRICLAVGDPPLSLPIKRFRSVAIPQANRFISTEIGSRVAMHKMGPPAVFEKQPIPTVYEDNTGRFHLECEQLVPCLHAEDRAYFLPVDQIIRNGCSHTYHVSPQPLLEP